MTIEIVNQSYTPKEFARHFSHEKCYPSRKWSQQVFYQMGGCEYDEGYPKFVKIITKSGLKIDGKITEYWENLYLKIFPPILQKSDQYVVAYKIPIENIISISVCDRSFPYKFAYDWHVARKDFPKFCLVAIEMYEKIITGRLIDVHKAFISYEKFSPITFAVAADPKKPVVLNIVIGQIRSIHVLPYTYNSLRRFEHDKNQIISKSLENCVQATSISLISKYIEKDIPDELPRIFYDYLKKHFNSD